MPKTLVSLVVPFYNEEPTVEVFLKAIDLVIKDNSNYTFELVAVNDGSKDKTLELLYGYQVNYKYLHVVNLSRNFGQESAIAAGLSIAQGDAVIPLDADLQDPPELIKQMLNLFEEGYEVVNARRASRKEDTFIKRFTASQFYKVIDGLSGKIRIPQNVGHFRLMSRRVVNEVLALQENNRVLRVQVPYVGFKTAEVVFVRPARSHGKTHYNMNSMIDLALNAITTTSTKPLNLIFKLALSLGVINFFSAITQLVLFILTKKGILSLIWLNHGVFLIINVLLFLTTLTLASLSLIALYLGKTFNESQGRPFYIIESVREN